INPLAATGTWSNAASWRASLHVDGTPGADEETLAQGSIVINEILANSDTGGDWIELYNSTASAINIGGWYLSDMPSQPAKFKIHELMYTPPPSGDEFVELLNITISPVQLFDPANPANTWKFTKGITFSFPQGLTLPAGSYLLLVAIDPATFRSKYGIPTSVP